MRNLSLQGEVRHAVPAGVYGKIVAVIRNTSSDGHLDVDLNDGSFDYDKDTHQDLAAVDAQDTVHLSKQPPAVFIMTSNGHLMAFDENDRLVWNVDLETVVLDSQDEDDDGPTQAVDVDNIERSEWFYASGFLQEESSNANPSNDEILGLNLNNQASLHITCLSRAGHLVSVSVDQTTTLALNNETVEEGSECIGSFENGLQTGCWSGDGEVLALVTFASEDEQGNELNLAEEEHRVPILMTMNTQYEILAEVRLDKCCHGEDVNAITLCWRPDSSSLAVSTIDAYVNDDEAKPLRRIRTFSRTTLELLSLSKEEDGSGRDVTNLQPVAPTWAPAGCSHYVGVIQSSRSLSSKTTVRGRPISMQVAFMEPNGLRHRECKIHMTYDRVKEKEEITGVEFNGEGDLLAVVSLVSPLIGDGEQAESLPYGKVQLYHRSNYHWYLKYELRYSNEGAVISKAQFSDPYNLMVALDKRNNDSMENILEWREYTFRWDASTIYYRNNTTSKGPAVLAMSIDGKTLNLTPLDKAIVPPPMYASSLEFSAPVVAIATIPSFANATGSTGVEFIASMSDGKLGLLKFGDSANGGSLTPGFSPPTVVAVVDLPKSLADDEVGNSRTLALRDLTIIDASADSFTVVAVPSPKSRGRRCDSIIEMSVSWKYANDSPAADITITASLSVREGRVLRLVNWLDGARGSALVELVDGTLLKYSHGGVLEPLENGHLLEPCPWIVGLFDSNADTAMLSPAEDHGHGNAANSIVVGLSSRYRLYCGERLISSATSSFGLSIQHRFLTHVTLGSRPQMRFLPISTLSEFDPLMGSDENALDGYEPRSVERGSRLVALFPHSPSVVIQMPRGNLESISPRALALPYVMMKIKDRDYATALDIMRRQRIDTNLIVDYDPASFLEKGGAETFIGQINKIDNINLFLSSLIDVDTTLWKYPVPSWLRMDHESRAPPQSIEVEAKVNRVCVKMREVMLAAEENGTTQSGKAVTAGHFLLPVLSTFAKEVPPRLEEALSLIKFSAAQVPQKQRKKTSILLSDHVQSSIQYLAFLADYELIFNTAIGMYDWDLAKAVARHSQMDPKVYLPMLKRWRDELPESMARFEVDVKLKRYESALRHLVSSGESKAPDKHLEECLKFIEEHKLHSLGLELFVQDNNFTATVMDSLGESLMTERKFEEALVVFLSSDPKNVDGAKRAAKACEDWRAYFSYCGELGRPIDADLVTSMAEGISSKMGTLDQQNESFAAAARILLDYGQDVAYAMDMFISGHMWFEGRRIAHLHNRPDLAKKCVDAAVTYADTCIEDLAERASTFEATNDKYAEVIVLRRDAIKEAEETGADLHDDSASQFSMQSTASNSSLRSTASASSIGSVGSVASVSTVISVGTKTGFQFTGDRDNFKHKSKFNKIGRDQKKKKKKKAGPAARRMKPGSEEHLKELVMTLTTTCPNDHYLANISETISFLLQSNKRSLARCLFEAYHDLVSAVTKSQVTRLEADRVAKQEKERMARKEGLIYENIEHPCEKEVNAVHCKPLPDSIENVMAYLTI
ncbi:hypothetical protein ACHAWO_007380 [Cyclotella atomus]|uniref:Elongator complex protein 1 n=1 Tax=Cyclotella atomus TaxID=382360 RepID=A0ABD3PJM7_9STRA